MVLAVWAIAACIGLTIAVCRLSIRLARLEAIAAAGADAPLPNTGAERPEIPLPRTDSADAGPGATDSEAAPTQGPSDSGGDVYSVPAVPAFPSRLVRAG